jgi:hypothetical protein
MTDLRRKLEEQGIIGLKASNCKEPQESPRRYYLGIKPSINIVYQIRTARAVDSYRNNLLRSPVVFNSARITYTRLLFKRKRSNLSALKQN